MMCYISQYRAVQHIWELLQVKISCKLYYTEFDIPLNQNSGWRLSCQLVCLQHRQLWQHNLQGGRNTHKADFCLWTLSGDSCQSWKNAYKPVRSICIFFMPSYFHGLGLENSVARVKAGRQYSGGPTSALGGPELREPWSCCEGTMLGHLRGDVQAAVTVLAAVDSKSKSQLGLWDFWENNILGFCNYLNWVLWIIQH